MKGLRVPRGITPSEIFHLSNELILELPSVIFRSRVYGFLKGNSNYSEYIEGHVRHIIDRQCTKNKVFH